MMSEKYGYVMMVQEKWWNEFRRRHQQGSTVHSYVQRGAAPPEYASLILFYVTKPIHEVAGYGEFIERVVGDADQLWQEHGNESVLNSKEQYEDFLKPYGEASFVRFKNLHEVTKPMSLSNFLMFLGAKRLARRGFYINKETTDRLVLLLG